MRVLSVEDEPYLAEAIRDGSVIEIWQGARKVFPLDLPDRLAV